MEMSANVRHTPVIFIRLGRSCAELCHSNSERVRSLFLQQAERKDSLPIISLSLVVLGYTKHRTNRNNGGRTGRAVVRVT